MHISKILFKFLWISHLGKFVLVNTTCTFFMTCNTSLRIAIQTQECNNYEIQLLLELYMLHKIIALLEVQIQDITSFVLKKVR